MEFDYYSNNNKRKLLVIIVRFSFFSSTSMCIESDFNAIFKCMYVFFNEAWLLIFMY